MERNLTEGSVLKTVVRFSLPYLLSYFLQTLYGMADLFIIGQFNGVAATTAVSTGSQIMHMITVMIVGLAMGTTVLIGQSIGAGKKERVSSAIGNTVILFLGISVILAVVLFFLAKPITGIMQVPDEAVAGTVTYLKICFVGIPFITAYNIISSIFRGLGDSKSPMYFIAVACAANIILDFVLIGGLGLGTAGAALGTVLGQTISVIFALIFIVKRDTGISLTKKSFRPKKDIMGRLVKVGIPVAFQDGLVQIAFLVITMIANMRGLNDAAAVGIVEKIICILFLVPSSMLSTVSAVSAQNVGAAKPERAREALKYAVMMAVGWGLIMSILMQFKAEFFVGLFTSDGAEVVRLGGQYLRGYIFDCIFAGIHFSFSGYFCGIGKSGLSFIHNVISIFGFRIPLVYLASMMFATTLFPMGLATVTGSFVSVIICIIMFLWLRHKGYGYGKEAEVPRM